MTVNRFASRGPSRGVVVTLSILGAVVVLAAAAFVSYLVVGPFWLQPVSEETPPESHSEAIGVKPSVFVPAASWNAETGAFELSAIVTARVDAVGTCSVAASHGETTLTAEVPAVVDASTMLCGNMSVPALGAQPGEWQLVVTYTADSFSAESEPTIVEVAP